MLRFFSWFQFSNPLFRNLYKNDTRYKNKLLHLSYFINFSISCIVFVQILKNDFDQEKNLIFFLIPIFEPNFSKLVQKRYKISKNVKNKMCWKFYFAYFIFYNFFPILFRFCKNRQKPSILHSRFFAICMLTK